MGKHGDRRDRRAAAFEPEILRHLKLANVEFPTSHETRMALGPRERNDLQIQTGRRHCTVDERARAVVVAARQSEFEIRH